MFGIRLIPRKSEPSENNGEELRESFQNIEKELAAISEKITKSKVRELNQENKKLKDIIKKDKRIVEIPPRIDQEKEIPLVKLDAVKVQQIMSRFVKYTDKNPIIYDRRTGAIGRFAKFEITNYGNVRVYTKPPGWNVFKKDVMYLVQNPLQNITPKQPTMENPDGTIEIVSQGEYFEQQNMAYPYSAEIPEWKQPIARTMFLQELERKRSERIESEDLLKMMDNLSKRIGGWRTDLTTFGEQRKIMFGKVPKELGGS